MTLVSPKTRDVYLSHPNVTSADALAALRVLDFQANNGFQHQSRSIVLAMVEFLGETKG